MNRLKNETSPYLLQHADNPVDWYAWGEEALEKARKEDKPILLSIGYSACHWCHVMAHESFEDKATAEMMNELFVNIKVDREERPDLDDIYMKATQIFNQGSGGWPMTVFMTPDGKPFHAGTYYPKEPRYGMPSFKMVMEAVRDAYDNKRQQVEHSANRIVEVLQSEAIGNTENAEKYFTPKLLERAAQKLIAQADEIHGGLHTGQPKFPNPMNLDYLLRYYTHTKDEDVLNVVTFTLEKMARGGLYDQLGYGFHRYSVDEQWLVPHFEKMLYDNAQLARVYLHAYQVTQNSFFAEICQQILTYVEREMLDEKSGGFYSTQDADSEGEEGKFFIWTPEAFEAVLENHLSADEIDLLKKYWDVTPGGNFEGHNILHVEKPNSALQPKIETARQLLFEAREHRIKPGRDEKMLAAWNGMMLAAFAEAGRVFSNEHYTTIARHNAYFILHDLSMKNGRLYRTYKDGESKLNGYLEDYACVIDGLLELYQSTFETRWFVEAQRLADHVLKHFKSSDGGGFYDTSDDHETLVARPRSLMDNATPGGNNLMAYNLVRLGAYTGQTEYENAALVVFKQVLNAVEQYPSAFGVALIGIDFLVRRAVEVAIIGSVQESREILEALQKPFRPQVITALAEVDQDSIARPQLLAFRTKRNNQPTIYVCQNFTCAAPVNTVEEMEKLLAGI